VLGKFFEVRHMSTSKRAIFGLFNVTLPEVLHQPLPMHLLVPTGLRGLLSPTNAYTGKIPKNQKRGLKKKSARSEKEQTQTRSFSAEGFIQTGQSARFMIGDKEFDIDSNTWIIGNVAYGAFARVKGISQGDRKIASQLVILRPAPANEG
jgi:hypothetical protein